MNGRLKRSAAANLVDEFFDRIGGPVLAKDASKIIAQETVNGHRVQIFDAIFDYVAMLTIEKANNLQHS